MILLDIQKSIEHDLQNTGLGDIFIWVLIIAGFFAITGIGILIEKVVKKIKRKNK